MKQKILKVLEGTDGFVSGEQLSRMLGVSRTAVWKNINALREEGYKIASVTNRGYRLTEKPDLLDAEKIARGLGTSLIGKKIEVMKIVDSTNDEVKRRARNGEPSGLVIAAEKQTGGKGRLGRAWSSDSGGIYFTVLLRPELPPGDIAAITLAAGHGVCLAVREYTGLDARIKWPNDIIVGNKKLCGILTEMSAQSDRIDCVLIGIGINVNHEEFPEDIRHKATSLRLELGRRIDRNEFFTCVLKNLDTAAAEFLAGFTPEESGRFADLCATVGRQVSTTNGGITLEGTAVGITPGGELEVQDENGQIHLINSGEVVVQGIY